MAYEIDIIASAYEDLDDVIYYYETQSKGLGLKFHHDFLMQLEKLKINPQYFRFYVDNFRRILLDKFPYLILYKITEDHVLILAIVYGGKDPKTISKRMI